MNSVHKGTETGREALVPPDRRFCSCSCCQPLTPVAGRATQQERKEDIAWSNTITLDS